MIKKNTGIRIGSQHYKPIIIPTRDRLQHMLVVGKHSSDFFLPIIARDLKSDFGLTILSSSSHKTEHILNLAKHLTQKSSKTIVLFSPTYDNCPYFNPLNGSEDEVVEIFSEIFRELNSDLEPFFKDMSNMLITYAVKIVKRLYGNEATIRDLDVLLSNPENKGVHLLRKMQNSVSTSDDTSKIINWFLCDYYGRFSKTYKNTASTRNIISKLMENKYLGRTLNPPRKDIEGYTDYLEFQEKCIENGIPFEINFDEAFDEGYILCLSACVEELRDIGTLLGKFLVQQMQRTTSRRVSKLSPKKHHMIYLESNFLLNNIVDTLATSKSSYVAYHIALDQDTIMSQIPLETVRNKIIFENDLNWTSTKLKSDEAFFQISQNNILVEGVLKPDELSKKLLSIYLGKDDSYV